MSADSFRGQAIHATEHATPRLARFGAESRQLLKLALPIIVSHLASVLMGFIDTVMSGRAGAFEQAVVGLGVAIWMPVVVGLVGVVQSISPIVAHHFGARDAQGIVADTHQALWLALLAGLLPALALPWAADVFTAFDVAPELVSRTVIFLQGAAFGLPAGMMFAVLEFYSASINRPKPAMVLGVLGLGLNAALNAGFIYGWGGLPKLGGAGCGWASGIGMWVSFLLMAVYVSWARPYEAYRLFRAWCGPRWSALERLLRIGLPLGGSALAEVAAFAGVALLIGSMGPTVIAAHQSALNFAAIMYMLPAGLSAALSIRVGQALGAGDARQAHFIAWGGVLLSLLIALALTPAIVASRWGIAAMYSADLDVQHVVANLMLFTAAWYWADAAQVCAAGALRGYHVTLVPMLAVIAAYWLVAIPLGNHLARHGWPVAGWTSLGVYGYWIGLLGGVVVAAIAMPTALYHVARRHACLAPS